VKISVARFIRKTPPFSGQVVDFEQLVRETMPFYGQIVDSGLTNISNKQIRSFCARDFILVA